MSTRLHWIAIVMMLHPAVHADNIADFQKACMETKKKAPLCQCLSSNVERKLATVEMDKELVVRAFKGQPPGPDENSTAYDVVADFIAGLEPHCLKNSKYSIE
jgi:hypothetical protein